MKSGTIISNTFYAQMASYVAVSLTATFGSIVDGIIIGQCLELDSIAAFGIASPLLFILSLLGAVLSIGARSRFVHLIGRGKTTEAQNMFSLACFLAVTVAAVMALALIVFSTPITILLGASGNAASLLPKARAYMIGIAIGIPARNLIWVFLAFMPIDNDRKTPVIASAVMTGVNILLDLAVVFILHGDTFEIGLVTSIRYIVALFVFMSHFSKKDTFLPRPSFKNISWTGTKELLTEGIPSGIHNIGHALRGIFMNRILVLVASSAAIAAYSVCGQAEALLLPLAAGISDTVSALSGVMAGEENRPAIKDLLKTSFKATYTLTLGISVLGFIFAPQLASCFIKGNSEAYQMSVRAIRSYAIGMPLHGINLIYQEYMHGIGKTVLSAVSGFLTEFGFLVLSAWLMVKWFGADAVWYAFPVTQVILLIYYSAITLAANRILGINRKGIWNKVLLFPNTFDVDESSCIDRSITSMEEVAALSQEVWDFCSSYGCDERRRYLMSLSVEEMAGNIIDHGFSKDTSPHSIDVRIMHKGDDFIIRIRDDCLIFDPVNQLKLYSDDDLTHHMGLRMIIKTAKVVRYTSALKLNNLFIRV